MNRELLAVHVRLDDQEIWQAEHGASDKARQSVWGTVSHFLQQEMNCWVTAFRPSATAWGLPLCCAYGVVLGTEEERYLAAYQCAQASQNGQVQTRREQLLRAGECMGDMQLGEQTLQLQSMDLSDRNALEQIVWMGAFAEGTLVPGCQLYHLDYKKAQLPPQEVIPMLRETKRHALCMVLLEAAKDWVTPLLEREISHGA